MKILFCVCIAMVYATIVNADGVEVKSVPPESVGLSSPRLKNVTISARQMNNWLEVEVSDEGIGIDKQEFDKLYQPFERLESRLKVPAGGAGLGLYLTKKIVTELMSGEVYFRSQPERGSAFGLRIPIVKEVVVENGS